jgi:peptide/nickel transport system permease protein
MLRYVVRRLLYTIPLLLGVSFVTFVLFYSVGGNPCYELVGKHATEEALQSCNQRLGFDRPFLQQYGRFLNEIVHFDFGRSFATQEKVSQVIANGIIPSLSVTIPAFIIGNILAIAIALLVAFHRGKFIDRLGVFLCVLGMSLTVLAYIFVGQYFLAFKLGLFPISGYDSGWAAVAYLALPVLIWVIVGLGYDVRFFRTVILDESNQDYVRTAFAKGLSRRVVFFKHILKNSLIPIITHVVIQVPFLITGSVLLENFFQIPGLGNVVAVSIHNSDFPVLKAMVLLGALLFVTFHELQSALF